MRIGMGYDVHRLVSGRDLIIGGVTIPYELGLLGHSDADVLLHAISDALLGAAALYMNAARCGKNALAILTVSDSLVTGEETTAQERQNSFTQMMEIALNTAVNLEK